MTWNAAKGQWDAQPVAAGPNITTSEYVWTTNETTTSTTFVDSAASLALPTRTGGKYLVNCYINVNHNTIDAGNSFRYVHGVTNSTTFMIQSNRANDRTPLSCPYINSLDGSTLKIQKKTSGGTQTIQYDNDSTPGYDGASCMRTLEIS